MELHISRCPACGYSLQITGGKQRVICPACGSQITVESDQSTAAANTAVRFVDSVSGQSLGQAIIPPHWQPQSETDQTFQSMPRPFTVRFQAVSPDGSQLLFANTGEAFHQIKTGIMQRHVEGQFDERTRTPMRNFLLPQQYLNQTATNLLGHKQVQLLGTLPLPRPSLADIAFKKQKIREEALHEFNKAQAISGGAGISLQNIYLDGLTCIYQFTQDNHQRILILGAEISGIEYAYQLPGAALLNGLSDLVKNVSQKTDNIEKPTDSNGLRGFIDFGMKGGLIGAMKRRQQEAPAASASVQNTSGEKQDTAHFGQAASSGNLASFLDWESSGVFGLLSDAPLNDEIQNIYARFVSSFVIDPSVPAQMKAIGQQITAEMQRQQQQQFAAQQQAFHTRQAAFDNANQAWWNRTQQQDAARRNTWQNRMAAEDRISSNFSEAIRGVNTYTRPDGSETEYSVSADRVFMKDGDASTLRSASFGEDVPFGWTELKKKDTYQ